MNTDKPRISVLMPVYNGEKHLHEAIDSILSQTFRDIELLVINDGSMDKSVEIVKSYADPRIRLINNERNLGIAAARNAGLAHARGEYVALLDSDDIALPDRFTQQIDFLDKNPKFGIIGSWVEIIDEKSVPTGEIWERKESPNEIPVLMLFNNYFAQSSLLLRKSVIPRDGYNNYIIGEDYDLWIRMACVSKVWCLQKTLTCYRIHSGSVTFEKGAVYERCTREIIASQLIRIGINPSPQELEIHRSLCQTRIYDDRIFLNAARKWLLRLYYAENAEQYYTRSVYNRYLGDMWFQVCSHSAGLGLTAALNFYSSQLCGCAQISLNKMIRFWIRCLMRRSPGSSRKYE